MSTPDQQQPGPGNLPPRIVAAPPGRASRALADRLAGVESRNVTYRSREFPIFWNKARGSNVWDPDGNRYVDLTAGFGVAAAGHGNRRVVTALRRQLGRQIHGLGDVHPPVAKLKLLELLAELSPWDDTRTILGNSGSEAVEAALKTARLATGRPGVLAFTGAYHGLTYGALALTDRAHFRAPFADQLNQHVVRVPFPPGPAAEADEALAAVDAALAGPAGKRVGAAIVEPIQGRGGIVEPPIGFLSGLAERCSERGILLIFDEIYTGCGRTGDWFALEHEGVTPDLLCLGKSMSGALPISACLGPAELMDAWPASEGEAIHTSTFLGNPMACAAATASLLEIRRRDLPARAAAVGAAWMAALAGLADRYAAVRGVRGRGLMLGLELADPDSGRPATELTGRLVHAALRRGWIVLPDGPDASVLSFTPPLTIAEPLLERATAMLEESLTELLA
ncbi:MAG TPA: aminotransferase class III-fold pyridoxal phosphate-dependent enzyme [Gemmatimonadota bacterium]|nr:aminotransferase class III-fold pyridoxal phosphate-dependent enzyme [Gemmatimonadota bacterium]